MGQLAVISAALLYAFSSVFIRRNLADQHPIVLTAISLTAALTITWIAAPIADNPLALPVRFLTWPAIAWLGIIGGTGAYLAYYYLIRTWGPTRSTMVTYVFPLVAVGLGVIFLAEPLTLRIVVGSLSVIGGILIVNWASLRHSLLHAPGVGNESGTD